jgi:hypothetical protein
MQQGIGLFNRTNIITFTPAFMFYNQSAFDIHCIAAHKLAKGLLSCVQVLSPGTKLQGKTVYMPLLNIFCA